MHESVARLVAPGPAAAGQLGRVQAHRERGRQLTELSGVERARRHIVLAGEGVCDQVRRRLEFQPPVRRDPGLGCAFPLQLSQALST